MTREIILTERLAQVTGKERTGCVYLWESVAGHMFGKLELRTQNLKGTFDAGPVFFLLGVL